MRTKLTVDPIESYCRASAVCVAVVIVVVIASAGVHEREQPSTMVFGTGLHDQCLSWACSKLFFSVPSFILRGIYPIQDPVGDRASDPVLKKRWLGRTGVT